MKLNLKGKKALITGGSKGIGLAIKKALEKEGVKCISWSRSEGIDLMKKIPKIPEVNFIIHNIGGFGTLAWEEYPLIMHKNFSIMAEIMSESTMNNLECVIAISSIFGKERGHNPSFDASKAAVIAFMKGMSHNYSNIRFNTICPGYINTKPEICEYAKEQKAPIGTPKDIANAVVFLCSEKAKFINGSCLIIDGGFSKSF